MTIPMCLGGGGGRESVSNWHVLVVVPQPTGFCILKKPAIRSTRSIFLHLTCHFLVRHFLAKCHFHSSVLSLQSCQSRRLIKTGPTSTGKKTQKLIQQTFREDYWTNIHVL